jgi:hypothetical protein
MPLVTLVKTSIDDTVTARFFPAASQYERWVAIRDQLATWDVPVTVGQVTDDEQEYVELSFPERSNYDDMVKALKAAMHINDIVGNNEQADMYETYYDELPSTAPGAGEAVESDVFPQD